MSAFPSWGRREVKASADFTRILNLPRRAKRTPEEAEELATQMTEALRTPTGTMRLRPVQALALYELLTTGGLAAMMGVGTGKTLVFLLAPVVLGLTRALGLLPASLREKTERERVELAKHWRVDRAMSFISYEELGREAAANLLEVRRPDGLIDDECHKLKNPDAACTKRVDRYMRAHPETKFVSMSGTYGGRSLHDMAHLLRWSLGAKNAPIPMTEGETREWADALDERVNPMQRVKPGVLLRLGDGTEEGDVLTKARRAFHKRLVSTPGVVCSLNDEQVNCSLYIEGKTYAVGQATETNFETLRTLWETPDGWALSEAVDVWRHARELALGFHYVWDPRPPDEWLEKRRAWAKFVRDILARSRHLDSEKMVQSACIHGELPDAEWREWEKIRPTFIINQKAVWHDESVVDLCAKWLKKERGICWVDHTFFGRELARRTGLSYYGQDGLDDKGQNILDAKGPIIASVAANGTGKNLQAWHKNLITSCPTGASVWEQLLGRTHRMGQLADEVEAEVLVGCVEHVDAWARARAEAQMAYDMIGQPQKLLIADVTHMPKPEDVRALPGARWRKTSDA